MVKDRKAWHVATMALQRARHNLATEHTTHMEPSTDRQGGFNRAVAKMDSSVGLNILCLVLSEGGDTARLLGAKATVNVRETSGGSVPPPLDLIRAGGAPPDP